MNKIQNEEQSEEEEAMPVDSQNNFNDEDYDIRNHVLAKDDPETFYKHRKVEISDNRRPIYGVLTEPLRGNLKNK